MKKTALSFVLASIFTSAMQPAVAQNTTLPNGVNIVRDLKDQDREVYESLKKGGGTSGVLTSTVVVPDQPSMNEGLAGNQKAINRATPKPFPVEGSAERPEVKAPTNAVSSGVVIRPVREKPAPAANPEIVRSEAPPVLDALDGRIRQQQIEDSMPRKNLAGSEPKTSSAPRYPDALTQEPGVRVVEKVNRKEVIERMIPPPDDMLYGALKKNEARFNDGPIVIDAIQGVNEIVTIGKNDLNRFVTPFERVKVQTAAGEEDLVSKVDGNIVYLGAARRVGVFITEIGSDRAISLTLVPDDVPARDIYLKLSRAGNIPAQLQKVSAKAAQGKGLGSIEKDGPSGKGQAHVDAIKDVMREMALGKLPNGYTLLPPKLGEFKCNIPGFRMRLGQTIEGSSQKIMVFRAENITNRDAIIDEQYCYKRGVKAVSAWPDVVVPAQGATEVYVMVKMVDEAPASAARPSLIGLQPADQEEDEE